MPSTHLPLERGGPKRLEISWGAFWRNLVVRLDGAEIGRIAGQEQMKAGQKFALPDGSAVHVQLASGFMGQELRVLRNGQPVPGSDSDPAQRVHMAAGMVFFIAGLSILLGTAAELFHVELLRRWGIGYSSVLFGGVFLLLGHFTKRRSLVALALAIGLFIVDGIVTAVVVAMETGSSPVGGMFFKMFLLARMIPGIGAIRALKREKATQDVLASV